MSMSSYVRAVIEPNEQYRKMYAVYEACEDAGIDPPDEVTDFFHGEVPNPDGMEVMMRSHHSVSDSRDFYDVYVKELPEGTSVIRFVNSY